MGTLIQAENLPFGAVAVPLNTQLSFLNCPVPDAVQAFLSQQDDTSRSCRPQPEQLADIQSALKHLYPLSFLGQRHLFVPTQSGWTAYFNNYPLGTNAHSLLPELAHMLECRCVLISAVPWKTNDQPEEVLSLTVLELDQRVSRRSLGLRNQAGFWRFWRTGNAFPFEDADRYTLRSRRRRFDLPLLIEYAAALGLQPFEEAFYLSGSTLVTCQARPAG